MIETKHGDHKIIYDEEANTWECKAMRLSAPSLAALKTKLNAEDRGDRRIADIRAFSMDRYSGAGGNTEIVITMIDTGRRGVNGYPVGSNSKTRTYYSLGSLVLINKANEPKIDRYKRAQVAYDAAEAELSEARAALPHPTTEELQKLSKAPLTAGHAKDGQ